MSAAFVFAAALAVLLLGEGNSFGACLIVFCLICVSTLGFNIGDGFRTPVGAYIFFVTLFTGLLGAVIKAFTNEPLLSNVPNADGTLLIYLLGTCGTVVAAMLSRRLRPQTAFLTERLTQSNTSQVVVGCVVVGIVLPEILAYIGASLASIARQLNITLPLAILIGVYQRTEKTGGRSSFSWPAFIAWSYSTWFGMLSYSKEQMFAPSLAWLIAAAAARLRVTVLQVLVAVPAGVLAIAILVPYSQYGRNFRNSGPAVAYELLRHPLDLREKVNAIQDTEIALYHWYDKPRGIFDRLTTLPIDSALIQRTDGGGTIGLGNLMIYFENIAPHFLLPDKPDVRPGNQYAHEIGMLAPDDNTTGISFSPFADAYHQAGWVGILVVLPIVQFLMFSMLNAVVGNVDDSPWGLFFIMAFGHIAAEGLLLFPVYVMSFGMEAIIATAFIMIYITPLLGQLVLGGGRSVPALRRKKPERRVAPVPPRPFNTGFELGA